MTQRTEEVFLLSLLIFIAALGYGWVFTRRRKMTDEEIELTKKRLREQARKVRPLDIPPRRKG